MNLRFEIDSPQYKVSPQRLDKEKYLAYMEYHSSYFLPLCLLNIYFSLTSSEPLVKISQGQLRGKWGLTRGGRRFAAFLGVPYAVPPVGSLRFQSPQAAEPWGDTVFDATKAGPACMQSNKPSSSEDCLNLNVFTPDTNPCEQFAVLVFLHGGSYERDSADPSKYGPEYLLDERKIILITIYYRIGLLGFLSLEDSALPGNLGLKDQLQAFKWIKNNIAHFGGNPEKVTIFGQSAGAASVNFHLLFTAELGLFRAGIMDSKSAQAISAFQIPGSQRYIVDGIVEKTRCPRDPKNLVDCLRKLPAEDFPRLLDSIKKDPLLPVERVTTLCPMIEPDSVPDRLVTADPLVMTTSLPILLGNNQKEGLDTLVDVEIDKTDRLFRAFNKRYETLFPFFLQFDDTAAKPKQVSKLLKNFYLPGMPIDREHYLHLVDMFSDAHYIYGQVLATRANTNKTFFYQLNHKGANTDVSLSGSKEYYGVSHGDELFYLFPMGGSTVRNITEADTLFSQKFVKMWVNFAKYLDPTPEGIPIKWTPVRTPGVEFLNIGQKSMFMDKPYLKNRMNFWDKLPYRTKCIPERNGYCSSLDHEYRQVLLN